VTSDIEPGEPEDRPPAGLTPERVGFFTDAVFAIAMTLLVIDIPKPEGEPEFSVGDGVSKAEAAGNLLHYLADQTNSFLAYLLAFWVLWITWRGHHTLFDRIGRLSYRLVGWHFPLLLLIGFLPYPTTVFGHHTDNPAAAGLYALSVAALLICRSGAQTQAERDNLLLPHVIRADFHRTTRASWIVALYWLATATLVWFTPWTSLLWFAAPIVGRIANGRRANP
jgi:uncharacterized membrane protein